MLTNTDIETLAPRMGIPLAFCDFKDLLPKKIQGDKLYIINLEDEQDKETREINDGSHWVGFQVRTYKNGRKPEAVYFDSYGKPPPKVVIQRIKEGFNVPVWHPTKDVQSIVNNACGFYQLAWGHYVNDPRFISKGGLKEDTEEFLSPFNDLNKTHDYQQNEFILKHFFQAKDPALRKEIDLPPIVSSEGSQTH